MSSASNVLSGTDEAVGRVIVATLAWGAAREALGHAAEFADAHPSELSSSARMQRVPRWSEQAT